MGEITLAIARQIKTNRERLNLTKKALADIVNTAPSTVSGWENGDYAPGADTIVKLTELFGISIDEFYGIDNKKLAAITDNELDKEVFDLLNKMTLEQRTEAKRFLRYLAATSGNTK